MLNPVKMCCNSQQENSTDQHWRPETNLLYAVRIGKIQYEEGSKLSDWRLHMLVFNTQTYLFISQGAFTGSFSWGCNGHPFTA